MLCFALTGTSQDAVFEWVKQIGSPQDEEGFFISTDADGNIYTTGLFRETTDFDPGSGTEILTSSGGADIFIQKLNSNGDFLWVKQMGGIISERGIFLTTDVDGNIYTTGGFDYSLDFDPGNGTANLQSAGANDIFIQKLDSNGEFLWVKQIGGWSDDMGNALTIDENGNIYVTGYFNFTIDFDPGAGTTNLSSTTSDSDIFILKLDPNGDFVWARKMDGLHEDEGLSITTDVNGNVFTTGVFEGTVDFDPGAGVSELTSNGGDDVFIQKLDSNGNYQWARHLGGVAHDYVRSVVTDALGNIYTAGYFQGSVDFDPGVGVLNYSSFGGFDIFIQKLDSNGDLIWANHTGGSSHDYCFDISTDTSGNIYSSGHFQNSVDFDPGTGTKIISSAGESDVYVQKLNANGDLIWVKQMGGSSYDFCRSLAIDQNGNVLAFGNFYGTADFDPGENSFNLISEGYYDMYTCKLRPCSPSFSTQTATACDSFTWIDGNTYITDNSTATHTLLNSAGCDSVITLDLTIYGVSDITTTLNGTTIIANNPNAEYRWLSCDSGFIPIEGQTSQSFLATSNGYYAVELVENGCVDTSDCVEVLTVGVVSDNTSSGTVIYPNPTSEKLNVQFEAPQHKVSVKLYFPTGQLIEQKTFYDTKIVELRIDQPAGVYLITISNHYDQESILRVVKK